MALAADWELRLNLSPSPKKKLGRQMSRNAPCRLHLLAPLEPFEKLDNQLVNVRVGGNCVEVICIDVTIANQEIKMLRQSRSRRAKHETATHDSAIGEHGTFLTTQFCLAFTSLAIPKKEN